MADFLSGVMGLVDRIKQRREEKRAEAGTDTGARRDPGGLSDRKARALSGYGYTPKAPMSVEDSEILGSLSQEEADAMVAAQNQEAMRLAQAARRSDILATLSDSAKGAIGLGQMIKGGRVNPTAPKYPEFPERNQNFDFALGTARELMAMGNPAQKQSYLEDMARNRAFREARARAMSGGDTGQYMIAAQAGDVADRQEIRKYNAALEAMKRQDVDRFSQLASTDRYYDLQKHYANVRRFSDYEYPEFKASRDYGAALVNTGLGNLFGFLDSLAAKRADEEEESA